MGGVCAMLLKQFCKCANEYSINNSQQIFKSPKRKTYVIPKPFILRLSPPTSPPIPTQTPTITPTHPPQPHPYPTPSPTLTLTLIKCQVHDCRNHIYLFQDQPIYILFQDQPNSANLKGKHSDTSKEISLLCFGR